MKVLIMIDTESSAFEDNNTGEVKRILSDIVDVWMRYTLRDIRDYHGINLYDDDGNKCGSISIQI